MRRSRGRAEGAFPEPCLPWGSVLGRVRAEPGDAAAARARHRDPCPAPKCHHRGASSDRSGIHEVGTGIDWGPFMDSADSGKCRSPGSSANAAQALSLLLPSPPSPTCCPFGLNASQPPLVKSFSGQYFRAHIELGVLLVTLLRKVLYF